MKKFTSALIHGNFEILHTGHIRLFVYAKEVASELTVALCVEGLDKTEKKRRLSILKSVPIIDKLVTYDNLAEIILNIKPDAIIKGREFAEAENIEEAIVSSYGGQVIFSAGEDNLLQTTALPMVLSRTNSLTGSSQNFLNRNAISKRDLIEIIRMFCEKKVLIVGDVILDEHIECIPSGLSLESATLVAQPLWSKRYLGGAGIVAAHCSALGSEASLLTILGEDGEAESIREYCTEYKLKLIEVRDVYHPTVLKQRFKHGNQTIFRLNRFRKDGIAKQIRKEFKDRFKSMIGSFDAVIFSDFSYGVFDNEDVGELVEAAKSSGVFIAADSQTSSQTGNLARFYGANLICPTEREARLEIRNEDGLIVLSQKLLSKMDSDFIFLKLGADGVLVNGRRIKTDHITALNENPIDVSGAGDSLIAASTLAFACEEKASVAAFIGSLAAAIQVSRPGNVPILNQELLDLIATLD